MTHGCAPVPGGARPRRLRRLLAAGAAAAVLAGGTPGALADGTTTTPVTPLPSLTLAHVHNFHTVTRWVTFRRGRRVLSTMIVLPVVSRGISVPVMEFAHGWHSNPRVYASMLRAWASAGFLVISPTSPGMARGKGLLPQGPASVLQAGDLPVVLTDVLAMALPVVPNAQEIALAGHSDGGCTVADMAFNARYRDARIDAYLIFSGARTNLNYGRKFFHANPKPVFIADSRADEFGDFAEVAPLYRQSRAPKVLVTIGRGERHLAPWSVSTLFHQRLWNATVDFSSWAFSGRGTALESMIGDLRTPGFGINLTAR
jgi:hypothetical protein